MADYNTAYSSYSIIGSGYRALAPAPAPAPAFTPDSVTQTISDELEHIESLPPPPARDVSSMSDEEMERFINDIERATRGKYNQDDRVRFKRRMKEEPEFAAKMFRIEHEWMERVRHRIHERHREAQRILDKYLPTYTE
jgi:hypothetical protein